MTRKMQPKIIKNDAEHKAFLAEVERLAALDPLPGTAQADRFELLVKLVEEYEKERYPIKRPDPISVIRFRMEEQGLRQKDIAPLLGGKNRASEVLSGKRPLTVQMIRALSVSLLIPTELLIGAPTSARDLVTAGGYKKRSRSASSSFTRSRANPVTGLVATAAASPSPSAGKCRRR